MTFLVFLISVGVFSHQAGSSGCNSRDGLHEGRRNARRSIGKLLRQNRRLLTQTWCFALIFGLLWYIMVLYDIVVVVSLK